MRHDIGAESRSDSLASIDENHRNRWSIIYRLYHLPVVIDIRQHRVVFLAIEKSRQLVELGEDISFARTVGTAFDTSPKLTIGFEQIDIVAADEILRHADNRRIQTRLTMVVRGMLGYIPAELRDLDFRFQTPLLERRKQDFTQRDFQPIHQVRNRPLIVVDREVDKTAVNELFIRDFGF